MASPASAQPRARIACSGTLRSWPVLRIFGSASQAASAVSSAWSIAVTSTYAPSPSAAAKATARRSDRTDVPTARKASATGSPSPACAASHAASAPGASASPETSKPSSASGSALCSVANSLSRSTRNSSSSNSACTASRSHGRSSSPDGPISSSTSRISSVSWRFSWTELRCARSASPALPLTSSTRSIRSSSEPNCLIHLAAVFSPTPGMFGRLSDGSPRSAAKSGYCCGVSPYFSSTASGVNRVISETPRFGYSTVTCSVTSCSASRSPVQMRTSKPSAVGLRGERGDDVVGLEVLLRQRRDAEHVEHLPDQVDLAAELVRRRAAVGLVVGEGLRAERLAREVERHRQVGRRLVAQEVDEHRGEPEDRVRDLPGLGLEVLGGQREERAVGHRMAVDQQQLRPLRGRRLFLWRWQRSSSHSGSRARV